MKKAVVSNRIFMNRTPELYDELAKELTYTLPPKQPGLPNEVVYDLTRVNKDILCIPVGRQDLIPEGYEIVEKRVLALVTFPKFKFTLRPEQQEVYDEVKDNTLLIANPSWGKTFCGIAIATKLKQKTLIIVHTMHLLRQWEEEVEKTLGIKAGIIGDKRYDIDPPIVIGTMQSLKNRILKVNKVFGTVIIDECHHIAASVFKTIVDAMHARYKIGLTATPWRKDGKHVSMFNYLGGEGEQIKTKDANRLDPKIILVHTDRKISGSAATPWAIRVNKLYQKIEMMELFLNLCQIQADKGHLVLAVADRVEFLKQCHEILEDSFLVVGGIEDRDFLASGKKILLGTSKIYAEGVNIPPLSALVMGMPLNNRGLLEQLIGRISRPYADKLDPEVIDIVFAGKTGKNQYVQRVNFYAEKGFKMVNI